MTDPQLLPVDPAPGDGGSAPGDRVNVFVHGYRSMNSPAEVERAKQRIRDARVAGESYLLDWMAGRWRESAVVAGARAAYRATRIARRLNPWGLLADAGLVGAYEAAQFKRMERRAEEVGAALLPDLLRGVAAGRPINLIGHSLGARLVHHTLAHGDPADLWYQDAVLLAGAADLDAEDWPDAVARLGGHLVNVYSRSDRILWMTPDLRRRIGARPMPQVVVGGQPRVINHHAKGYGHVRQWTALADLLPTAWPDCQP